MDIINYPVTCARQGKAAGYRSRVLFIYPLTQPLPMGEESKEPEASLGVCGNYCTENAYRFPLPLRERVRVRGFKKVIGF